MGSTRRTRLTVAATALCAILAACSAPAEASRSPSGAGATVVATTSVPLPPITADPRPSAGCSPALVLDQVDDMLAGGDFEAHYLTIADKFTLSIWFVDPELDPDTPALEMASASRRALARGLSLSYRVIDVVPCAGRVFDQINPMIVDSLHRHWYKDFLPVSAFAGLHDPSTADLIAAVEATGTALEKPRGRVPPAVPSRSPGSCGWSDARAAIHRYLGDTDNTAAYLIIGAGLVPAADGSTPTEDVGVEVQWPVAARSETTDPIVRERLGHVATALACLEPPIDSLEAFLVDRAGHTAAYVVVTGVALRTPTIPLPAGSVRIFPVGTATLP